MIYRLTEFNKENLKDNILSYYRNRNKHDLPDELIVKLNSIAKEGTWYLAYLAIDDNNIDRFSVYINLSGMLNKAFDVEYILC